MTLNANCSWTLIGLIGAFVDLWIAFLLLWTSGFVFLTSKLLYSFGLHLPCPCTGFLGYQDSRLCLHRLLVYWPLQKIYHVHQLAKSSFPFNLVWSNDQEQNPETTLIRLDRGVHLGRLSALRMQKLADKENICNTKDKKILHQKQRAAIRRRKRAASIYREHSSDWQSDNVDAMVASSSSHHGDDYGDSGSEIFLRKDNSLEGSGEVNGTNGMAVHINRLRSLDQSYNHEKVARAALYLELEKERAAAETAADEAMAMILRLQEEKASLEMEARQYERMMEEKFNYEEEEMNILKEIVVKIERDNHFLEKELEAYKHMDILESESEGNLDDGLSLMPLQHIASGKEMASKQKDSDLGLPAQGLAEMQKCSTSEGNIMIREDNMKISRSLTTTCDGELDLKEHQINNEHTRSDSDFVYDVHVIDDKTEIRREKERDSEQLNNMVSKSRTWTEESFSNSPPPLDSGLVKIDAGVEWLRELVRIAQDGKEKLTCSAEHGQRVSVQSKLMEEVVNRFREIQELPDPVEQVSPPSSSR